MSAKDDRAFLFELIREHDLAADENTSPGEYRAGLALGILAAGFSRAAAPEPEWEYARQNRYGNVCEPDDSREQAEYRASLGGGYDTVVRRPLVTWEPLPVPGGEGESE